jgi:hypothetical protein
MAHLLARIAPRARRTSFPTAGATALALVALCPLLWLYVRSAAPSVLAGDSAEFQFAAPLLGVPHPTGYPLYIMLGKLASLLPLGDVARRVTLLSALLAAATCALVALIALRLTRRPLAALLAALALGVTPGVWNIATIPEAYALNLLLIAALGYCLVRVTSDELRSTNDAQALDRDDASNVASSASADALVTRYSPLVTGKWLCAAAFITGLGVSHHGSFAFIAAPVALAALASQGKEQWARGNGRAFALCPFFFALGLSPWLYILASYAVWGPFSGDYHGLPRHYFWGAPASWGDALAHIAGGPLRGAVFAAPDVARLLAVADALAERMRFEWGQVGLLLGAAGSAALLWRAPRAWLATAWVFVVTAGYFACLTRAVQDALIFTLPMLLPWALWIACGAAALADGAEWLVGRLSVRRPQTADRSSVNSDDSGGPRAAVASTASMAVSGQRSAVGGLLAAALLCILLALTLQWGRTRLPYGNKSDQWLFRQFGEGALERVAPDAVVLARWEQGTTLLYLRLVEQRRPDVLVDVIEPEDEPWGPRAAERYAGRPVYMIGGLSDADALGASPVWHTDYAGLYELRPKAR